MIEHKGKNYYIPFEVLDIITDSNSELSQLWAKHFPKFQNVVLIDQISRVLTNARKKQLIKFVEFKKNKDSNKVFYAYAIEDIIEYIKSNCAKGYDVKLHEKE